jgi:hypothetical protein
MARKRYIHCICALIALLLFIFTREYGFPIMCCIISTRKQCFTIFFNRAHTRRPQFDKFSIDADIGAYQTGPEKVENEAGFTPTADLYGLFSSLGKAADSHEEQKVGDKFKCYVGALLSLRIPIRSKSFVDG